MNKPEIREGTFFLGGGGLGNFGIFFQKSVGPSLHFDKKTPESKIRTSDNKVKVFLCAFHLKFFVSSFLFSSSIHDKMGSEGFRMIETVKN